MTNPVHHTDTGWYFWDETWSVQIGPYETEGAAQQALSHYYLTLEGLGDDE